MDTPVGAKVPISQVAEVRVDQGPNTINVANRDLGSVIDEIRTKIAPKSRCPKATSCSMEASLNLRKKQRAKSRSCP